jgi:hypothetical protein
MSKEKYTINEFILFNCFFIHLLFPTGYLFQESGLQRSLSYHYLLYAHYTLCFIKRPISGNSKFHRLYGSHNGSIPIRFDAFKSEPGLRAYEI